MHVPGYGFARNGKLVTPKPSELWREFFARLNFIGDCRNWLPALSFFASLALSIPFFVFIFKYVSLPLILISGFYSYFFLNIHGTIYLHRYSSHKAFHFRNDFWTVIFKNIAIKIIPEEVFAVSHYVHHAIPEKPGDPYNATCGWLYCFIADVNHQSLARDLTEKDYGIVTKMLDHIGSPLNSYAQYRQWGSAMRPFWTIMEFVINWSLWFFLLSWIGGPSLAFAVFSGAFFWAIAIRNFNYKSHGSGQNRHRDGIEFHRDDLSMNLKMSGFAAGEWHNNHHLYPRSARAGFKSGQLDLSWVVIKTMLTLGIVTKANDDTANFRQAYGN